MQTIHKGAQGLGLIVDMSWDRFFFFGAMAIALAAASQIGYLAVPAGF
ncbi:MAG: hypothetical protein AAGA47_05860 [Pseudomonadota bacterium]